MLRIHTRIGSVPAVEQLAGLAKIAQHPRCELGRVEHVPFKKALFRYAREVLTPVLMAEGFGIADTVSGAPDDGAEEAER